MYLPIARNKRNTIIAMAVFMLIFAVFGAIIAGLFSYRSTTVRPSNLTSSSKAWQTYAITTFDWSTFFTILVGFIVGSLLYLLYVYNQADRVMLRQTNAKITTQANNPRLYNMVQNLATVAGVPMPEVYIIEDASPNAFATGKNPKKSAVAVTTGIMEIMDDRELEAVLSHEISHIKNYDIRVNTMVFGLTMLMGLIVTFAFRSVLYSNLFGSRRNSKDSSGIIFIIIAVAVIASVMKGVMWLIQLAVSRQREYLADATGAELMHDNEALASALNKLRLNTNQVRKYNVASAHLFFSDPDTGDTPAKIGKPGFQAKLHNLFNTHPPLEMRIARLRGFGDINQGFLASN